MIAKISNLLLIGTLAIASACAIAETKPALVKQASTNEKLELGRVYGDPTQPAPKSFKPHELPFQLPQGEHPFQAEYRSKPFYAVILKSDKPCSIGDEDRLPAQKLFPSNKVFVSRFYCDDDIEENMNYTNVNSDYAFMAVYAGQDLKAAKQLLKAVQKTKKYPGANIRKMTAVLVMP